MDDILYHGTIIDSVSRHSSDHACNSRLRFALDFVERCHPLLGLCNIGLVRLKLSPTFPWFSATISSAIEHTKLLLEKGAAQGRDILLVTTLRDSDNRIESF